MAEAKEWQFTMERRPFLYPDDRPHSWWCIDDETNPSPWLNEANMRMFCMRRFDSIFAVPLSMKRVRVTIFDGLVDSGRGFLWASDSEVLDIDTDEVIDLDPAVASRIRHELDQPEDGCEDYEFSVLVFGIKGESLDG